MFPTIHDLVAESALRLMRLAEEWKKRHPGEGEPWLALRCEACGGNGCMECFSSEAEAREANRLLAMRPKPTREEIEADLASVIERALSAPGAEGSR